MRRRSGALALPPGPWAGVLELGCLEVQQAESCVSAPALTLPTPPLRAGTWAWHSIGIPSGAHVTHPQINTHVPILSTPPRPARRHLGLAFQVVDDIMDFTCSAAEMGKPALNDLRRWAGGRVGRWVGGSMDGWVVVGGRVGGGAGKFWANAWMAIEAGEWVGRYRSGGACARVRVCSCFLRSACGCGCVGGLQARTAGSRLYRARAAGRRASKPSVRARKRDLQHVLQGAMWPACCPPERLRLQPPAAAPSACAAGWPRRRCCTRQRSSPSCCPSSSGGSRRCEGHGFRGCGGDRRGKVQGKRGVGRGKARGVARARGVGKSQGGSFRWAFGAGLDRVEAKQLDKAAGA